ncbi:F0F1 ATP synthase subunit epsilon [Salidesulfovibrio brasiliensis]|uniref:F0F1 ATP synthase subunit epsilon n=1 Tax=Salidesulfovibrio brasiliensis TaxID=221711 RepID=UPI0006D160D7|nr:F0F1 ATP synthase subunit epsilon [Salidesulfovibrio brasiliensis]
MASTLKLEIVTPDRKVLSEDVEYVGCPGVEGEFGILANHVPFLSALGIGNLYYKQGGKNYYVFVAGGFAEVSDNKVTILAEVAEKASEIDVDRAEKARARAEQRAQQAKDNVEFARNQAALKRAIMRASCTASGKSAGTC